MEELSIIKQLNKICIDGKIIINPYTRQSVYAPCGTCPTCLTKKSSQNTIKCVSETMRHKYVYLVNLDYKNLFIPKMHVDRVSDTLYKFTSIPRRQITGLDNYESFDFFYSCNTPDDHKFLSNFLNKCFLRTRQTQEPFVDRQTISFIDWKDIQLFFKRLRFKIYKKIGYYAPLYYYAVSEYGTNTYRAHFHILLCFDAPELAACIEQILPACWRYGRCVVLSKDGSPESYVAGYVNSFTRLPEFLKNSFCRPKSRFSNHFGKTVWERHVSNIVRSRDEKFFLPFFNGITIPHDGETLTIVAPRSIVRSCFFPFASNGRLSIYDNYKIIFQVSRLIRGMYAEVRDSSRTKRITLLTLCKYFYDALYNNNSILVASKFLKDFQGVTEVMEYARWYDLVHGLNDRERYVNCLYRLFRDVYNFCSMWNVYLFVEDVNFDKLYMPLKLSMKYYSEYQRMNLKKIFLFIEQSEMDLLDYYFPRGKFPTTLIMNKSRLYMRKVVNNRVKHREQSDKVLNELCK